MKVSNASFLLASVILAATVWWLVVDRKSTDECQDMKAEMSFLEAKLEDHVSRLFVADGASGTEIAGTIGGGGGIEESALADVHDGQDERLLGKLTLKALATRVSNLATKVNKKGATKAFVTNKTKRLATKAYVDTRAGKTPALEGRVSALETRRQCHYVGIGDCRDSANDRYDHCFSTTNNFSLTSCEEAALSVAKSVGFEYYRAGEDRRCNVLLEKGDATPLPNSNCPSSGGWGVQPNTGGAVGPIDTVDATVPFHICYRCTQ